MFSYQKFLDDVVGLVGECYCVLMVLLSSLIVDAVAWLWVMA